MPIKKKKAAARKKVVVKAAPKKVSAAKKLERFTMSQKKAAFMEDLKEQYGKKAAEKVLAKTKTARNKIAKEMNAIGRELRKFK